MPDWFEPTAGLFPAAVWLFWIVGLPWALALLPRELWRARVIVIAVGMALGPVVVTTVMFALGTAGTLSLAGTLTGSTLAAALGAGIAYRRRLHPVPDRDVQGGTGGAGDADSSLGRVEWLLIAGIALLVVLNVVVTAYWPFIAYDTQWVYGYNAKIFVTEGRIPDSMGYYPQLVPLSYTFMQQVWHAGGGALLNDHAARVVVPWFNVAAILMAYTLGRVVFGRRRVALLTAAVWALYPHVAAWSGAGDLEITLTLYMTGAAAFFIRAWRSEQAGDAIVSGLLLAGALWTKPTGGALALGVMLAVAGGLVAARFRWEVWRPKLRIALAAGLASAPLGSMWYLRNVLLEHTAVVFPAGYWHDFAQRSGQEFGWPVLIAILAAGGLVVRGWRLPHPPTPRHVWRPPHAERGRSSENEVPSPYLEVVCEAYAGFRGEVKTAWWLPVVAVALLLAATLPTALNVDALTGPGGLGDNVWLWVRGDWSAAHRLEKPTYLVIAAGFALLAWAGRDVWRGWSWRRRETVLLIWALLLPYGVVWFLDFSYHYRLSFPIVPLAAVQVAALIDGWLWGWLSTDRIRRGVGAALAVGAVGVAVAAMVQHSAQVWTDGGLPDDRAKYDRGNPALMVVVHMLEDYAAQHGEPVVAIPGEDRLPFFFPDWEIRNSRETDDLSVRLEDLQDVDVFVNTSVGVFLMQRAGLWPNSLQADADVGLAYYDEEVRGWDGKLWPTALEPIPMGPHGSVPIDDGNFRYTAFTVHPDARQARMQPGAYRDDTVIIGGFAQFIGHDLVTLDWVRTQKVPVILYWQPTGDAPPLRDYSIFLHLLDENGDLIAQWDGQPLLGAYPTRFWRSGESLLDFWPIRLPEDVPTGPATLRIGIYDPLSNERLPVMIDGVPAGDGLVIDDRLTVIDPDSG